MVVEHETVVPLWVQLVADVPEADCAAAIPQKNIAAKAVTYVMPRVCNFMLSTFSLVRLTLTNIINPRYCHD